MLNIPPPIYIYIYTQPNHVGKVNYLAGGDEEDKVDSEALTLHRSHVDPGDPRLKIMPTLGPEVDNYLHWAIWIPRAISKP